MTTPNATKNARRRGSKRPFGADETPAREGEHSTVRRTDPMFEIEAQPRRTTASIKVIGVGGAGGNAVNRMIVSELGGVEFMTANTDLQALEQSRATVKLQLGPHRTRGLGSGGDPTVGRAAAEEDESLIAEAVEGADMVFITSGMGGGTGTGGAPVVARMARQAGALTVAVVSKPFHFEGRRRMRQAEEGLAELRQEVDTLIVIPNERLLSIVDRDTPLSEAFAVADEVLLKATKGISDLVTVPGLVNLDFADVKSIMQSQGNALMGTGRASGKDRAIEAARQAIASPLLEDLSITGATGVLLNITGGRDLSLHEVNEASQVVLEASGVEANVIFGAVIDPNLDGEMLVTVIATGFGGGTKPVERTFESRLTREVPELGEEFALAAESLKRPAMWRSPRRVTGGGGHEHLDVPAFLRRQSQ
jgi:cell division protein FtsZ